MLVQILFTLGFILVGGLFLFRAVKSRLQVKQARSWPSVKGKVTSSEVQEDRFRNPTGKASIAFIPAVEYEYNVSGVSYTGERVTFGSTSYDYIISSKICEKFGAGSTPDVFYNPADPAESVLAPKSTEGVRSMIPGIFLIVTGILIGLVGIFLPG